MAKDDEIGNPNRQFVDKVFADNPDSDPEEKVEDKVEGYTEDDLEKGRGGPDGS